MTFEEEFPEFGLIGESAKDFQKWMYREPYAMMLFNVYREAKMKYFDEERVRRAHNKIEKEHSRELLPVAYIIDLINKELGLE